MTLSTSPDKTESEVVHFKSCSPTQCSTYCSQDPSCKGLSILKDGMCTVVRNSWFIITNKTGDSVYRHGISCSFYYH